MLLNSASLRPFLAAASFAMQLALTLCLASSAAAQLPAIEVSAISPTVAQAGSQFELSFSGNRLEELSQVIFNPATNSTTVGDAAHTAPLPITAQPHIASKRLLNDEPLPTSSFDVQIADSAAPGLVEVQAVGRFGISNPRRILITQQPVIKASPGHTNVGNALAVAPGTILSDSCSAQQRNYYTVRLTAGQTLRCAAYAQPLDTRASLVMTLVDRDELQPSLLQLAQSRSVESWPAELSYTADRDRELVLIIHDILFQGGVEYAYVLETSTQPDKIPLELNTLLRPGIPKPMLEGAVDAQQQNQPLTPPFTARGTLHDGECNIEFTTASTEPLEIRVSSREFGCLTDPTLVIYKLTPGSTPEAAPTTTQLAQQDDQAALGRADVRWRRLDPALVWAPPEAATYRVQIVDQQAGDRSRDATQFLLSAQPVTPSFELLAYAPFPTNNPATARNFGSNLMRGGTASLHLLVDRRGGYQGPIEFGLEGLPVGLSCQPTMTPAGVQEADLIIVSAEDSPAWHGPVRVIGRAPVKGVNQEWVSVSAKFATVRWGAIGTRNAVQHRDLGTLWLSNNADDLAPLHIQLGDGTTLEATRGAKLTVPIKLNRRAGAQAECTLRPQSLGPGVALGEIKIAAESSEGTAELTIAGDAPPGEFSMWMQVETKLKFRPNPQSQTREESYLTALQAALAAAASDEQKAKLNETIQATTARIEELKKQTAEQEFTVWIPSTTQNIRVLPPSN